MLCKESNEYDTKETLQTNKQKALTSLQVFASTLNMLLCLLFCFVSFFQSSSVFPRIHFSPVCEFLVIPCKCSHCENGSFEVLSLQPRTCNIEERFAMHTGHREPKRPPSTNAHSSLYLNSELPTGVPKILMPEQLHTSGRNSSILGGGAPVRFQVRVVPVRSWIPAIENKTPNKS